MQLRRCHTRAQVKDLAISPQQLRGFLNCGSEHPIAHAGSTTVFRIEDRHLAATLQLTPKRWAYLKQLIMHPPPPSVRAQHQDLLKVDHRSSSSQRIFVHGDDLRVLELCVAYIAL